MSANPKWEAMFLPEKIKHSSVAHRKDFILDCLFIGTGVAILHTTLTENFVSGVNGLHRNRDRKKIGKIKIGYELLLKEKNSLYSKISGRDMETINHKLTDVGTHFINEIASCKDDINLEILASSVLRNGLMRKRKTNLRAELTQFANFMFLQKNILKHIKDGGILATKETQLTKKFVGKVRY